MRVAVGSESPRELSVQRAPRKLPEIEITRIKIHRLNYRFSIEFLVFGNHKHLAKVSRLWCADFSLEIFNIHWLVWIFLWIFGCLFYVFH